MASGKQQRQISGFTNFTNFTNSSEYKNLSASCLRPSIFGALGALYCETRHSGFFACFLAVVRQKHDHYLGNLPISDLPETLALACGTLPHASEKPAPDVGAALIVGNCSLSEGSVKKEKYHVVCELLSWRPL